MRPQSEVLGVLQPVGGGDPIPLIKPEIIVGRRPSCDIRLDFENISGKHCVLRLRQRRLERPRPGQHQRHHRQRVADRERAERHARRRARHRRSHVHDRV